MHTTSPSLLQRLRQPDQQAAWARFVELYTPLLCSWAHKAGFNAADTADLVQEVLTVLVQKLPDFSYDPSRSFRGWLRTVTINKFREKARRRTELLLHDGAARADPADADPAVVVAEADYHDHLVRRALELMQAEFQPTTWKACWEYAVQGRPADEVARELQTTVDVVYAAKSRVLRRLREELAGLLD
jgi:RNA polymerase sigma-70 factor (ECF subfamily)